MENQIDMTYTMKETSLNKEVYRDLLKNLRNGTTPEKGQEHIAVGLAPIKNEVEEQLKYVAKGRSDGKFIQGEYGAGKTFLSKILKEKALSQNFVVSEVVITPDVHLDNQKEFYSALVGEMRTKERRQSCAFSEIIEQWFFQIQRKVQKLAEGESKKNYREWLSKKLEKQIEKELTSIKDLNISFANALRCFLKAKANQNNELASDAIGWMKGDRNLSYQRKKAIGVKGDLEDEEIFNAIKSLLNIIRSSGYNGLFIILDEVEVIQRLHTSNQRNNAYETLRKIVDSFGSNSYPGAFFLITGTSSLFNNRHVGIPSYEALHQRISSPSNDNGNQNYRQLIIKLPGFSKKDLAKVAIKIRDIHAETYLWEAHRSVSDKDLKDYASSFVTRFGEELDKPPRAFLKSVVELLDQIEQYGGVAEDYIGN